MKTKTLMIGLVLMAVVLAPLALATPGDGPRGERGPRGGGEYGRRGPGRPGGFQGGFGWMLLGRAGDKLELTEEQREQIKAVLEESKADDIKDAVAEAMKALHEATAEGTEAEIIAAGKAVGDAFTQRALKQAETMNKIKEILTDEQKAKLEEMKAKMKERMQQRHEGDFDGPPRWRDKDGKGECDRRPRRREPRWD